MSDPQGSLEPGPALLMGLGIAGGWSIYQWNLVSLMVAGSNVEHGDAVVEASSLTSGRNYSLEIAYEADGTQYQHAFTPKKGFAGYNVGDMIPIRYLPEDPEVVGLGDSSSLPIDGQICLGLAAIFVTYAVFAAVFPGLRI